MIANTCGACAHHRLVGPLGACGFGRCAVRPNHAMREGIATSQHSPCRIGRFEAKKQDEAMAGRESAQERPQAPPNAPQGLSRAGLETP